MKMEMSLEHRIEERALAEIKVYFKPAVFVEYCKACKYYSEIWTCPPYDFDASKLLEGFRYIYIIGSKLYVDELKGRQKTLIEGESTELASNRIYEAARAVIDERLMEIGERKKDLRILLAGRCLICSHCTREEQLPCIHPEKAQLSLESIGFDVASICEEVLGDRLQWAKEGLPEYFLLVSAILSSEKLDIGEINHQMG